MRKFAVVLFGCCICVLAMAQLARSQGRDWMADNGDAQRSAWVRSDAKINKDTLSQPGFQFLWKLKLKNAPNQLNNLTTPSTLERLIGYRGFRMLGFVGGSGDNLITIDTDLGRIEWEKHLNAAPSTQASTLACPGGMTTSVVRPTIAFMPGAGQGGGPGRNQPAKSAVGEPGQGGVTLANVRPNPPAPAGPPPGPPPGAAAPGRPGAANPPGGQFGRGPFWINALASDGMLHTLHLSNGAEAVPPARFLPPNANASGLIVVDQIAYAVTTGGCGGVANGVWAYNQETKQVTSWKGNVAGSVGAAFAGNGTLYVATGSGGEAPNSLVALEPTTLKVKASFSAGTQEFSSSPVVFEHKGKTLVAAATANGSIHILDTANLAGGPLASSATLTKANDFAPGALTSWQDASGTRWFLAPVTSAQAAAAGFKADNGALTKGAVAAWKVVEEGGALKLQPGWVSRDLMAPLTPTIINGVAFVTSSGEARGKDAKLTAARSQGAILYALDAVTGKELWNSGKTVLSFAHGNALSGGVGQLYLTTNDGTIYAFGFPMEH